MARPDLPLWGCLTIGLLAIGAAVFSVAAQAADGPTPPPAQGVIVADASALRAAPRDGAPLRVALWRGEAVQLRGARGDWLQVWDPHRERGGFVRAAQVMPLAGDDAAVPELAAQLRLLRQQPGAESLGIGVAAALVERAGAPWLASAPGAELLDTMVVLLQRLAERAEGATGSRQAAVAAQVDVAARYGFALRALAQVDGSQRLCPNLSPARLLRGHPAASAAQQARAALALTVSACPADDAAAGPRVAQLAQQAAWLDGIELSALPVVDRNRLLLRRAAVLARLAFAQPDAEASLTAAAALSAWGQLVAAALTDDDAAAVRSAAILLSPQRWLLQPVSTSRRVGRFELRLEPAAPGETCLTVVHLTGTGRAQRCSHGRVHLASARVSPDGHALALAVQPLDGWTELWRIDRAGDVQVLPPSSDTPGLGAVEWAGWIAGRDGAQVLVAREAEAAGRSLRRFEVYDPALLKPVRWAGDPALLAAFQRHADPSWRGASTIVR